MSEISTEEKIERAVQAAAAALYFDDSSDYKTALWDVLRALVSAPDMPEWGGWGGNERLRQLAGFEDDPKVEQG